MVCFFGSVTIHNGTTGLAGHGHGVTGDVQGVVPLTGGAIISSAFSALISFKKVLLNKGSHKAPKIIGIRFFCSCICAPRSHALGSVHTFKK